VRKVLVFLIRLYQRTLSRLLPASCRFRPSCSEYAVVALTRYGDALTIGFPTLNRGPLDIYVQLRGYDRFVEDTQDRPQFVHDFLALIVRERAAWNRERRRYLGEPEPAEPTTRIDDDWVNVPFISPAMFREFVIPAYRRISAAEGQVVGFHTCGVMVPVVGELLGVFPGIRTLDISGWNDFEKLDEMLDPQIGFWLGFKNTFVLAGAREQQRDKLERIARVGRRRAVGVCAQAIVRLHKTYEENLGRMNAFIALAREEGAGVLRDCIELRRVESRFGNGDMILDQSELNTAMGAFYMANNGPQTMYGPGLNIRFGFEFNF
jgi:hypothetical protein